MDHGLQGISSYHEDETHRDKGLPSTASLLRLNAYTCAGLGSSFFFVFHLPTYLSSSTSESNPIHVVLSIF